MVLHDPHIEVRSQTGVAGGGVYIAWMWYGSPASRYGVRPTRRILAIDGQATPDLDAFLDVVAGLADQASVRVEVEDLDGREAVLPLVTDEQYWPTEVIDYVDGAWQRQRVGDQ